jgi:hypothetical protein
MARQQRVRRDKATDPQEEQRNEPEYANGVRAEQVRKMELDLVKGQARRPKGGRNG